MKNKNVKTYKIEGMDCEACAKMIELDLEDAGINAKCSFPRQLLEVEIDNKNTSEEKIKEIIENGGYKLK